MNDTKQITNIKQLTGLNFRAAQSEMAALLQQEARLRTNLADLIESRRARAMQSGLPDDPAMIAGADLRWHRWVDQRRAIINGELAQILSAKESCRAKLQRAFGRDQAAQAMSEREARAQLQISKRRSDY